MNWMIKSLYLKARALPIVGLVFEMPLQALLELPTSFLHFQK